MQQRLFEILYILLQKRKTTAKELAQHFEVSSRTIYRDIDTLSMAGIPIYTNKGKHGGICIMENYVLQKSLFTDEEQQKLMTALQCYKVADREEITTLMTKLSATFSKHQINWIDVDFSDWNNDKQRQIIFETLKDAILQKNIITFVYHNAQGVNSKRCVEPLQLKFKGQAWYLLGYCREKENERYFKLRRIKDINITKEHFERVYESKRQEESVAYQVRKERVKLRIKAAQAFRVFDEFDEKSYTMDDHGDFLISCDFVISDWIYGYILSYGEDIEVLEPVALKDYIIKKCHAILENYINMTY